MSELGEALELLHAARGSFKTLRAHVRHWRDPALELEARLAFEAPGGRPVSGPSDPDEPQEILSRCWIQQPGRVRVERTFTLGAQDSPPYPSLLVVDGDRWWSDWQYGPFAGEGVAQNGVHTRIHFDHLFDPRDVVDGLDLEVVGPSAVAGREGIRLRGTRAPTSELRRFDNVEGATGYELVVDAERGILLRMTALFGARECDVKEILDVGFDENLEPELFVFASKSGAAPRPTPGIRPLTLNDCRTYPGFTVLVPSLALSSGEGFLRHIQEQEQWALDEAPRVSMRYSAGDLVHYIDFDQSRASVEDLAEHGVEEPGGSSTNFLLFSDEPVPGWHVIEGVVAGTFVGITSNFDLDTLLRFVRSLIPVDRALGSVVTPESEAGSAGPVLAQEPHRPPDSGDAVAPDPVVAMPAGWDEANVEVDDALVETMKATSGTCRIVIACADAAAARDAVDAARAAVGRIPHPEEPDDPLPSFVSGAEPSAGGSSFWFDMADAEAYDGLVEEVLSAILAAAVASGLRDARITAGE